MEWLRGWLMGIVAAALAVSLAQALTPEGTVKKVGRLVGGLVLLLAVAQPFLRLDLEAWTASAVYEAGETARTGAGDEVMKTLIAEKTGAYIVDKGGLLGMDCTAEVTVSAVEGGWSVPWSVTVRGRWTQEQRESLSKIIAEELNIPVERQVFEEESK